MASSQSPSSPHLNLPQTDSRPDSRTGRADEALLRGAIGAKKLLSSWSRSRTTTPEPLAPLCTLARSQSQLQRSTMAQPSDMMTSRASSRASPYPTTVQTTERQPTLARSLMSKSSRFLSKKKSVPKLRPATATANVSAWDDDDDDDPVVVRAPPSPSLLLRSPPPMPIGIRKESISTPYNFQHLTHTSRKHARTLQDARRENLVNEFSALRAAQKPHAELQGIRAEDIPSGLNSEAASLASPLTSRPTTPGHARGLKTSKSVDHLRPAAIRSFSAPLGPIQPPPRKSSRKPVNLANVKIEATPVPHPIDSPTLPTPSTAMTTRDSPASNRFPTNTSTPTTELSYEELTAEIAQAVTTPDDSAYEMRPHMKQGSCSTLSDLPEMDESARKSERDSQQSLRHIKSMPSVKHFSRSFSRINWGSQTSLNATDPTLPSLDRADEDVPAGPVRRSTQPKSMHESWEDSVDYCYDFAMDESEVDALMMEASGDTPTAAATPAMTGSANSSAVSFHDATTPANPHPQPYALSPSLLSSSREFPSRVTHEEQYGHRLAADDDESSKGLYNYSFFYSSGYDGESLPPLASSPRSSRSLESSSRHAPLSKSSSQDSFSSKHSATEVASGAAAAAPPARLMRAKASREQLGLMGSREYDATVDLPRAIDTMRQDLLRAVEAMPDEAFDDALARTMSPTPGTQSPTRLNGRRTPEFNVATAPAAGIPRRTPPPRYTGSRDAPLSPLLSRNRAASTSTATVKPPPRGSSHRISYSLFPQPGTRT